MRSLTNVVIFWAFFLVTLVALVAAGGGKPAADAETYKYHGYALVEVWIGRAAVNAGDLQGQQMFSQMMTEIGKECPPYRNDCNSGGLEVPTHYVKNMDTGEIGDTAIGFLVQGVWQDEQNRLLLINAIVKALQSLTETGTSENCYAVPGHGKFCNIGNFIRVNLPHGTGDNHMWVRLFGKKVHGEFKCCPTRYKVDGVLDSMKDDFVDAYPQKPYSRDVKCLIKGMIGCEDCGDKCDACGRECP